MESAQGPQACCVEVPARRLIGSLSDEPVFEFKPWTLLPKEQHRVVRNIGAPPGTTTGSRRDCAFRRFRTRDLATCPREAVMTDSVPLPSAWSDVGLAVRWAILGRCPERSVVSDRGRW